MNQPNELRLDYTIKFDVKAAGWGFEIVDVNPGEEASAAEAASRLLGLAKPFSNPAAAHPTPTVAEAAKTVLEGSGLKLGSVKEYRRAFSYFGEFVGADTTLGAITQERFSEFCDHVKANTKWAPKTKSFMITSAQRLFTFYASRNDGVPKITAAGLKPKRSVPIGRDRDAFELAEIEVLLAAAMVYRDVEPAKWWVTIASLFLGARLEELSQAHLHGDFGMDAATGIHFLEISERVAHAEYAKLFPKSVKSQASWRRVPIHPQLIKLGFLDYLEAEKAAGAVTPFQRCWPALREGCGRVKHSHAISKWGGKQLQRLRNLDLLPTEQPLSYFHSMRHTFITQLGKADVSDEWRSALTGHNYGGVNAQVYNKAKWDVSRTLPKLEMGLASLVGAVCRVTDGSN